MGICRKKVIRRGMKIRKIAAAAARDQYFLANLLRTFEDEQPTPASSGFNGAHQPGRTASEYDGVIGLIHAGTSLSGWSSRSEMNAARPGQPLRNTRTLQATLESRTREWRQLRSACRAYRASSRSYSSSMWSPGSLNS